MLAVHRYGIVTTRWRRATKPGCFGAAYEFVFNVTYQLRKQKLKVPVAYVSAEPFPGHFGIGGLPGGETLLGMFFRRQKIEPIFDVAMEEVAPGELRLADGRTLPFKYGDGRAAVPRG